MKIKETFETLIKENSYILVPVTAVTAMACIFLHMGYEAGRKYQADYDADLIWDHRHDSVEELIKVITRLRDMEK